MYVIYESKMKVQESEGVVGHRKSVRDVIFVNFDKNKSHDRGYLCIEYGKFKISLIN